MEASTTAMEAKTEVVKAFIEVIEVMEALVEPSTNYYNTKCILYKIETIWDSNALA